MIDMAEVYLWGTRVGVIWQKPDARAASFEYDKNFLQSGMELSPFFMPLAERVYSFPSLANMESFRGLPGLLADSLPDKFGNAIINKWLAEQGRVPESFSAIERLCYTGKRGMGALEYVPANGPTSNGSDIDITEMAKLAGDVLAGRERVTLSEKEIDLTKLLEIGSSAGGARAKAVIAWNEETGEIRSGQIDLGPGFKHWLLKFDGVDKNGDHGEADPKQYSLIEYAYYLMAIDAGIQMQECRLLEKDGRRHFMTARYDRIGSDKLHVQTLGALSHLDYNTPGACSYELYASYADRLGVDKNDKRQIFKRLVFSVIGMNHDDHVKNFSFIMDRKGVWRLAPAYDVTFAYNPNNKWLSHHQMTIRNKTANIMEEDLLAFGKSIRLNADFCKNAIYDVKRILGNWKEYAGKCGIKEERADAIQKILNLNGF